ncbi:MAG: hypothetical protein FWB88_01345 [Defluviitaleaceae bacterium]|nr:hypothetical protein [Defluviitaleaceae bacterium]MCL2240609.1 hypothetical protein [Defluviitaleaceae bacterium]
MFNKIQKLKSLLIVALAALAIYQTGQLWFVHITQRNVFVELAAFWGRGVPDGYADIARPTRVIFGNGDGRFDMRYGTASPPADEAIAEILRRGVFGGVLYAGDALYEALGGPVIIYEYVFPMRAEIFALAFNQRSGAALTDRGLETFYAVAVLPGGVLFFDDEQAWRFNLPSGALDLGYFEIDTGLFFVHYAHRVFLPRTQTGWRHGALEMTNPYINQRSGEVELGSVNAQVGRFFSNPAVRNPRMVDNVITISTLNTVVRYLPGNVLEFSCFRPVRRNNPPDFMTDFSAALAFVYSDPHIGPQGETPFFLVGYEARGRTHVFWFNYVIGGMEEGGFPLLVPEEGWGAPHDPLRYPIEVIVDHGHVTRYRKLAFTFRPDMTQQHILFPSALQPQGEGRLLAMGYPPLPGAGLELRWARPAHAPEDER